MPDSSEKSIFLSALDHESVEAREAFLRSACGEDAALRASIDALLAAHQRSANPLDRPVAEAGCVKLGSSNLAALDPTAEIQNVDCGEDVGSTVGPYRLMEKIGEGGFGFVYVAQQDKPVRRKVALKIIKPGTGSKEVLARFDAERQAVALMDHPHIAQIFDAGVTDDARPYFVMELVRGVPVADFCDQHDLTLRQRLQLFEDVCAAIHHAHQKGVIHRDLKPSNVLVTLHDAKPVVKVIDFGVAKAVGQSLTDQTIYTRFYSMVGTPLYMSPEQASMSGLDVDTRSDIYSLGVMLYELLTGTTPIDRKRLDSVGFDEMRRIIREEEPPKPSTRLTTINARDVSTIRPDHDDQSPAAKTARTDSPNKKRDTVPTDLDWIVMKAMEKDRTRRYESAAAMAADLRRFLSQEPIEARPPSRTYRLAKFARRNRAALITGALVASALVVGTLASLYQASRAIDERNQKETALQESIQAKNKATEARLAVEQFSERLKTSNSLLATARVYEDDEQYDAASDAYDEAVELVPNYYLVWVQRATLLVKMKLWDDAAEDFSAAMNLDAPVNENQWHGVPALFCMTGRVDDYATICSMLMKPSEENPQALTWSVIRGCLAAPTESVDPKRLAERAEQLLANSPPLGPRRDDGPPGPLEERFNRLPPDRLIDGRSNTERPRRPGQRGPGQRFDRPAGANGPGGPGRGGGPGGRGGPGRPGDRWREDFLPRHVQHYVAGLANLRADNIEKAIEHLQLASEDRGWPAADLVHSLMAIAHHASQAAIRS